MLKEFKQDSLRDLAKRAKDSYPSEKFLSDSYKVTQKELLDSEANVQYHALQKLIFFHIHGLDCRSEAINALKCITTGKESTKVIGYQVAQFVARNNDVCLQSIPELISKDLTKKPLLAKSALSFVANVPDAYFGSLIVDNIKSLLNLEEPVILKKTIVAYTQIVLALLIKDESETNKGMWEEFLVRMLEMLEDNQTSLAVQIPIIASIHKVAGRFPNLCLSAFLPLIKFFESSHKSNWIILKLLDIFNIFFEHSAQLRKEKLVSIFGRMLDNCNSISVSIQLVFTILYNFENKQKPNLVNTFSLCERKLKSYLAESDNNLLIFALKLLKKLFKKKMIKAQDYLSDILNLIESKSDAVKKACFDTISLTVDEDNFKKVSEFLLGFASVFGKKVVDAIVDICCVEDKRRLKSVENNEWYEGVLFELSDTLKEEKLLEAILDYSQWTQIASIGKRSLDKLKTLQETNSDKPFVSHLFVPSLAVETKRAENKWYLGLLDIIARKGNKQEKEEAFNHVIDLLKNNPIHITESLLFSHAISLENNSLTSSFYEALSLISSVVVNEADLASMLIATRGVELLNLETAAEFDFNKPFELGDDMNDLIK